MGLPDGLLPPAEALTLPYDSLPRGKKTPRPTTSGLIFSDVYRQAVGLPPAKPRPDDGVAVDVYHSLEEGASALEDLARRAEPWTFDIETYDAAAFPGRKEVATDSFHPDFRVRGVAVALSATRGVWFEFGSLSVAPPRGLAALRAAFASDAGKAAFNGGFDDNGMVVSGWVPEVRNRDRDPMLAMIALGDGTHERLTLEHAVAVLLKRSNQYWGEDKSLMRELPTVSVADGSVRDACLTHELCDLLYGWAVENRHIEWSKMGGNKNGA